jgi:hypothetical protein
MIEIGRMNSLRAFRQAKQGWYLRNPEGQEVLLPNKYVPEGFKEEDELDVFIFNDSEDRITATTATPKIQLNDFAYLQVKEVNKFGAFLDWGLEKDLLVPFSEQQKKMLKDEHYLVYMYLDARTERLVASSKLDQFLEKENIELEVGQEVDLIIGEFSELGAKVIINKQYSGLIFQNEIFQKLRSGDHVKGFIKQIREDKKIDVSLQQQGYAGVAPNAEKILEKLNAEGGFLALNDKSDPKLIQDQLEMSKKTFKKAIGGLYKQKLIKIEKDGIYLLK